MLFSHALGSLWADYIMPLMGRRRRLQLAALCHRDGKQGREVLLITSSNGRWIIPKGWPIDGKSASEAALQEAWEEAGVKKSHISKHPVGSFLTEKRYADGRRVPCEQKVFLVKVRKIVDTFPEAHRRKRIWVSPAKAIEMVDENGLKNLIGGLERGFSFP